MLQAETSNVYLCIILDRLSWVNFFVIFLGRSRKNDRILPEIDQDLYLPHYSYLIIH